MIVTGLDRSTTPPTEREIAVDSAGRVILAPDTPMSTVVDSTSTAGFTYICEAAPGSLPTAAVWRISRVDTNGSTTWAGGNASFTNTVAGRTGYAYS